MKFLILTTSQDQPVLVNLRNTVSFAAEGDMTQVVPVTGYSFKVKESFEDVCDMIGEMAS